MLKTIEQMYIRKMAKLYRAWKPETSIGMAIHQAQLAYEMYREAEVEMMDEEYQRIG